MLILLMVMLLNLSIVRPNYRQTVSDGANGILRNTTTAMPLKKYLRNFWRSVEVPSIKCKIKWKLRWANLCILSAAGADNDDANSNIIFLLKETKLFVPVVILSAKKNKKNQKLNIDIFFWFIQMWMTMLKG